MRFQPIPVDVTIEGAAAPVRVVVDQRDLAAAEAAGLGDDTIQRHSRTRFLAWSAGRRAGHWRTPWPKFNDQECVHAEVPADFNDDDDADGETGADALDPGQTGPSGNA